MATLAASVTAIMLLAGGGVGAFQSQHHYPVVVGRVAAAPRQSWFHAAAAVAGASLRSGSVASVASSRRKPHYYLAAASATTTSSELDPESSPRNANNLKLEQKTWMFQDKYPIAYEVATNSDASAVDDHDVEVEVVPILLLNGFGVGSFHQHRLMRQLLLQQHQQQQQGNEDEDQKQRTKQYVIYGIDYLGQGKSWPANCDDGNSDDELNLGYSADMWLDQLTGFIEEVIVPTSTSTTANNNNNNKRSTKVHLVGNSVGGYLSAILADRRPDLISSLALMNATPVWGLNLPGWDGRLPAPPLPKFVGRKLFDAIRDSDVIDKYLEAAYVRRDAYDGSYEDGFDGCGDGGKEGNALPPKIRGCTEGNGGHAAFASILWSAPASEIDEGGAADDSSPPTPADFYGALENLPADVLLLFGEDDPWCTPAVAKRMHTTLAGRGGTNGGPMAAAQRYVSLDNVGHCPNHEAPTAVAKVLLNWIGATTSSAQSPGGDDRSSSRNEVPLVSGSAEIINEPWGEVSAREVSIEESKNLGIVDRIVSSMVG